LSEKAINWGSQAVIALLATGMLVTSQPVDTTAASLDTLRQESEVMEVIRHSFDQPVHLPEVTDGMINHLTTGITVNMVDQDSTVNQDTPLYNLPDFQNKLSTDGYFITKANALNYQETFKVEKDGELSPLTQMVNPEVDTWLLYIFDSINTGQFIHLLQDLEDTFNTDIGKYGSGQLSITKDFGNILAIQAQKTKKGDLTQQLALAHALKSKATKPVDLNNFDTKNIDPTTQATLERIAGIDTQHMLSHLLMFMTAQYGFARAEHQLFEIIRQEKPDFETDMQEYVRQFNDTSDPTEQSDILIEVGKYFQHNVLQDFSLFPYLNGNRKVGVESINTFFAQNNGAYNVQCMSTAFQVYALYKKYFNMQPYGVDITPNTSKFVGHMIAALLLPDGERYLIVEPERNQISIGGSYDYSPLSQGLSSDERKYYSKRVWALRKDFYSIYMSSIMDWYATRVGDVSPGLSIQVLTWIKHYIKTPNLTWNIGNYEFWRGNPVAAEKSYEEANKSWRGNNIAVLYNLARTKIRLGKFAEAQKLIDNLTSLPFEGEEYASGIQSFLWVSMTAAWDTEDWSKAFNLNQLYDTVTDEQFAGVAYDMGQLKINLGDEKGAITYFQEALNRTENVPGIHQKAKDQITELKGN